MTKGPFSSFQNEFSRAADLKEIYIYLCSGLLNTAKLQLKKAALRAREKAQPGRLVLSCVAVGPKDWFALLQLGWAGCAACFLRALRPCTVTVTTVLPLAGLRSLPCFALICFQ